MVMAAQAGDLIVHHAAMIHRAPANLTSDRSRKAVGAIFYGASARRDETKYEERQQEIRERAALLKGQGQGPA